MKEFVKKLLGDGTDISSKRFWGSVTMVVMLVSYFISVFMEIKVPEFMWDGLMWIVLGMFGGSVLDKFAGKKTLP